MKLRRESIVTVEMTAAEHERIAGFLRDLQSHIRETGSRGATSEYRDNLTVAIRDFTGSVTR